MHKPNVTVAAVVQCGDEFLFVEEQDKYSKQLVINQPAGHLEKNESLLEACHRELLEETGLKSNAIGLVGIYNLHAENGVHYLRFTFAFHLDKKPVNLAPLDSDILRTIWLTPKQLSQYNLRSELVERCVQDSLTRPLISLNYIQ